MMDPSRMASPNGPPPRRDAVVDSLVETCSTEPSLVAVFGATSFDVFHVGSEFKQSFEGDANFREHIAELAAEARTEFFEHDLFAGLRPTHERIEYQTRSYGNERLLQVYCGGRGMLLVVDTDQSVKPLVQASCELLAKW
jgi:hypothetical protein